METPIKIETANITFDSREINKQIIVGHSYDGIFKMY